VSRTHTVLVVEDHETTRESLREILERDGCEVFTASRAEEAKKRALEQDIDVILTDLRLPDAGDRGGLEVLELSRKADPGRPVVLLTAHGSVDTAVEAMKKGAHDYLEKPLDLRRLRRVLEGAFRVRDLEVRNQELSRQLSQAGGPDEMVGESPEMEKLHQEISRVARTTSTVLITGESGSGKELVANAMHRGSARNQGPLIKVHLGALPRELIESELFGHERGAFTGAVKRKLGRFELADGGTLFLDEIAEIPPETQVKLLRVLETLQFERVGGTSTIKTDVRLVAATHQDLKARVEQGRFREDLFYRINVVSVEVPPLRERKGDVRLLVAAFSAQFPDNQGRTKDFTEEAVAALERYKWPGNVRELRNVIERLAVIIPGSTVRAEDLPEEIREAAGMASSGGSCAGAAGVFSLKELEKDAIRRALVETKGVKKQAARLLGIGTRTLYRKMAEYEIG
jgi:two-component system, NtrC family, response regulator AtoC